MARVWKIASRRRRCLRSRQGAVGSQPGRTVGRATAAEARRRSRTVRCERWLGRGRSCPRRTRSRRPTWNRRGRRASLLGKGDASDVRRTPPPGISANHPSAGETRPEAVTDEPPEHPVEAWRENSRVAAASRMAPVPEGPKGAVEDPLADKHRATRFDRDFRTLDYANLSRDEAERETERRRRMRQQSSWHPAKPGANQSPPVKKAQFSPFGGSTISAEVIRGRADQGARHDADAAGGGRRSRSRRGES